MKREHECRAGDEGARLANNEHVRDCNTSGCPGCKPCVPEHGHCTACKHEHLGQGERWRCARCVGKVRRNLLLIDQYVARAHREVVYRGINSAAFLIAAPAADPEAHGFLHQSATSGRLCKCRTRGHDCPGDREWAGVPFAWVPPGICPDAAFAIEDARDELHPLTVLGWWEMLWRIELDLPSEECITVASARGFLDDHLTGMAQRLDPDFEQFRTEVRDCKTWLENVLGEGIRPERGVECFMCGKARVEKWYDDTLVALDDGTVTGKEDHWYCPREECGHWWSDEDYRTKVSGVYVTKAPVLTASQIASTYRVPEGTVRGWASATRWRDALVRRRGKDQQGRVLYDVADVLAARDRQSTPTPA